MRWIKQKSIRLNSMHEIGEFILHLNALIYDIGHDMKDVAIFYGLYNAKNPVSINALAEITRLNRTTVTRRVRILEQYGYIARNQNGLFITHRGYRTAMTIYLALSRPSLTPRVRAFWVRKMNIRNRAHT